MLSYLWIIFGNLVVKSLEWEFKVKLFLTNVCHSFWTNKGKLSTSCKLGQGTAFFCINCLIWIMCRSGVYNIWSYFRNFASWKTETLAFSCSWGLYLNFSLYLFFCGEFPSFYFQFYELNRVVPHCDFLLLSSNFQIIEKTLCKLIFWRDVFFL